MLCHQHSWLLSRRLFLHRPLRPTTSCTSTPNTPTPGLSSPLITTTCCFLRLLFLCGPCTDTPTPLSPISLVLFLILFLRFSLPASTSPSAPPPHRILSRPLFHPLSPLLFFHHPPALLVPPLLKLLLLLDLLKTLLRRRVTDQRLLCFLERQNLRHAEMLAG